MSVVKAGAIPRFAYLHIEEHCISLEPAEKLVNERPKAIMPVHLYGNVCDMDKVNAFARKHKLFVTEDNAEAFGGSGPFLFLSVIERFLALYSSMNSFSQLTATLEAAEPLRRAVWRVAPRSGGRVLVETTQVSPVAARFSPPSRRKLS